LKSSRPTSYLQTPPPGHGYRGHESLWEDSVLTLLWRYTTIWLPFRGRDFDEKTEGAEAALSFFLKMSSRGYGIPVNIIVTQFSGVNLEIGGVLSTHKPPSNGAYDCMHALADATIKHNIIVSYADFDE